MIQQETKCGASSSVKLGGPWSDLNTVLQEYLRLKDCHLSGHIKVIGPLLDDWITQRSAVAASNRINGAGYNPLTRLKIDETTHSRILGDLLNPNGTHGQGDRFLLPFLEELGIPEPKNGIWRVTVETGRVDILIWRNSPKKSAIIIENKSNDAGDRPNQIYRYWHQEIYLWDTKLWLSQNDADIRERNRCFHIVYLPTDEGKSPASHSMERPVGMEEANPFKRVELDCRIISLANLMSLWEKNTIPLIPPENHRLRTFLIQYQELWMK